MFCHRSIEVILSCWWTTFCWSIHHSNGKPGIPVECCMEDSFWDDLDLLEAPIDWIGDDKTNTTYSQISGRSINKHPVPVLRPKFFCWVGGEEPVLLDADYVDTRISTAWCWYISKRIWLPYKDALLDLASPNVPYKTKKRFLKQEGSSFIEDVLAPVVSSLGFLML